MKKNWGEPSAIAQQSDDSKAIFSRVLISKENIIGKSKWQCFTKKNIANNNCNEDVQSSDDRVSNASSGDEWELPFRKWREMTRTLDNVTLSLPAKSISKVLAATCATTNTSNKNEMKLVTKLFKAGGADLNDANLSILTIRCQRKS